MIGLIDQVFIALSGPTGLVLSLGLLVASLLIAAWIWRGAHLRRRVWTGLVLTAGIAGAAGLAVPFGLAASRPRDPPGVHHVGQADLILPTAPSGRHPTPTPIRVWYPSNGRPGYAPDGQGCAGLADLPIAGNGQARRLILYMPHLTGRRDDNIQRLTYLASHGFVVVAFDDIAHDPATPAAGPQEAALRKGAADMSSQAGYDSAVARFNLRVRRQADKALSGLDSLAACAAAAPASSWARSIDHDHVGFLGFSFGGATAAEAAALDPRIAAVASLDGHLYGQALQAGFSAPYLYLMSGRPFGSSQTLTAADPVERHLSRLWSRDLRAHARLAARPGSAGLRLEGSEHASFSDAVLEPHLSRRWLLSNPVDLFNASNRYTLAFFDAHLRGRAGLSDLRTPTHEFVVPFSDALPWPPRQDAHGAPLS